MNSADFTWNTSEEELFSFSGVEFNVRAAKCAIEAAPREVETIPTADLQDLVGMPGKIYAGRTYVDWTRALSDAVDPTQPIILAMLADGSCLPIDGYHRIAKAKATGVESLPAVVLSLDETYAVCPALLPESATGTRTRKTRKTRKSKKQ